jgi:hypothetical protein
MAGNIWLGGVAWRNISEAIFQPYQRGSWRNLKLSGWRINGEEMAASEAIINNVA